MMGLLLGLCATLGLVLFPVLHWMRYRDELLESFDALPELQLEPGQRWFHLPKVGTLRGTLVIRPAPEQSLLLEARPPQAERRSGAPPVAGGEMLQVPDAPGQKEAELAVQAVVQKRRLDVRMETPPLVLFPRSQGLVMRSLERSVKTPFRRGLQASLYVFFFFYLSFCAAMCSDPIPHAIKWEYALASFLVGGLFSFFLLGASFLGRTIRGEFPMRMANQVSLTGHREFDERYCVKGDEDMLLACLPHSLRDALMSLEPGVMPLVEKGKVSVFMPRPPLKEVHHKYLSWAAQLLLRLSQAAGVTAQDIPARLLENVKADPVAGVRLRSLRWLRAKYSHTSEAQEALEYALGGDIEELKALAKTYLRGDEESALGGQLSVALLPEKQGQLSVAIEERGQLSINPSLEGG